MKRSLLIGGVIAVLVGMAFVMPAVALLRDQGALPTFEVGCLLLGLAITLGGAAACAMSVKYRRA